MAQNYYAAVHLDMSTYIMNRTSSGRYERLSGGEYAELARDANKGRQVRAAEARARQKAEA